MINDMDMKKILYVGIFSGTNIGDLAISNSIYNYLKNKNQQVDCMDFISLREIGSPYTSISRNICNNVRCKINNALYKNYIVRRIYNRYLEISLSKESHGLYITYKKIIDEYDIVCIGGGNLLMSIFDNRWAIVLNTLTKLAKKADKKIFIISVGAGPILLNKSKKLFKDALESVDYITVRDEYSFHVLKDELNVNRKIEISGDPVFLLDHNDLRMSKNNDGNNDTINISISVMPFGKKEFLNLPDYNDYKYYLDMYKHMIDYLYDKDERYVFYLFSTEWTDYETIIELYRYIINNSKNITRRNLKIEYIERLDHLLNFYRRQHLLIGTRMHSLIIGYTQLLPIIAISWQTKVESFMGYVDLMPYCYQLNSVNMSLENIYANVRELLRHNQQNSKLEDIKEIYDDINSHYINN